MIQRTCLVVLLGLAIAWFGCPRDGNADGNSPADTNTPADAGGDWYKPDVGTTWQWQLQPSAANEINITYDVDAYDIDLFDTSTALIDELHGQGRRVICYFSAGTYEDFRTDAGEFAAAALGNALEEWAGERWLDIRAANVRQIMLARLDLAVEKGCDCVEPDNVDGYVNDSGFALTAADQLAFNRFIANEAHARGLCVGLKNDLDQISQLVAYFDFSVNEQCHEYDECDALQPFIDAGKPVFNAEYAGAYVNNAAERTALCDDAQDRGFHTLVLPLNLDDAFRLSCAP